MDQAATAILIVLGMIAFANYRNGTLVPWIGAKFFNTAAARTATPFSSLGQTAGLTFGAAAKDSTTLTGLGGGLGALVAPVHGPIPSGGGFGAARVGHSHEGVDFDVPVGTPVAAARAGRVTWAGPSAGYGLRVDIDHGGGVSTRYGHLSRITARLGQTVAAGATIALSGNTGESTGPHVHFELRVNGVARDPLPYVGGALSSAGVQIA